MSWLRDKINESYVGARGVRSGIDPAVGERELLQFVSIKAAAKARATLRRLPQAYVAPDVRLLNRHSLDIGRGVSIARGVVIDAMSRDGVCLEDSATIDIGAVIRGSGGVRRLGVGVTIRRRAAVGAFNFIHGGGGVVVGEDVLLGPHVQIFSENHVYTDLNVPIIEQGEQPDAVTIGRGTWVGAGAIILAGVTIGEGAVVAAGAVVSKDIPPHTVSGGNPARVIRMRE